MTSESDGRVKERLDIQTAAMQLGKLARRYNAYTRTKGSASELAPDIYILLQQYDPEGFATDPLVVLERALDRALQGRVSKLRPCQAPTAWVRRNDDLDQHGALTYRYYARRFLPTSKEDKVNQKRAGQKGYDLVREDLLQETQQDTGFIDSLFKEIAGWLLDELQPMPRATVENNYVPPPTHVVRVDAEDSLTRALNSNARLIWVTGEVGTGKSWLVDHVLRRLGLQIATIRCTTANDFDDDLARFLARHIPPLQVPGHRALLRDAVEDLLCHRDVGELLFFDGLDDESVVGSFFERSAEFLTSMVITSRMPEPNMASYRYWNSPIVVGDFDLASATTLATRYLPSAYNDEAAQQLAVSLCGRARAIVQACQLIETFGLDVNTFCLDVYESRAVTIGQTVSTGTQSITRVYEQALKHIESSPYGSMALLMIDLLVSSGSLRLSGWTIASVSRYLTACKEANGEPTPNRLVDNPELGSLIQLFRQRGATHIARCGVHTVKQSDYVAIYGAISLLEGLSITSTEGDSLHISLFASHLLKDLRRERISDMRMLMFGAAVHELNSWHWQAGETLPVVLMEWGVLLSHFIRELSAPSILNHPENLLRLLAVVTRAIRQLPLPSGEFDDVDWVLSAGFTEPPGTDSEVTQHLTEQVRARYSEVATRENSIQLRRAMSYAHIMPDSLRYMCVFELTFLDAPIGIGVEIAAAVATARQFLTDDSPIGSEKLVSIELRIAGLLYAAGSGLILVGKFALAARMLQEAADRYRRIGASVEALTGEIRALSRCAEASLRLGSREAAQQSLRQADSVVKWAAEVVAPKHSQLVLIDERTRLGLANAQIELAIAEVVSQLTGGAGNGLVRVLPTIASVLIEKYRSHVALKDDGLRTEILERLCRINALSCYVAIDSQNEQPARHLGELFEMMRGTSLPQKTHLATAQIQLDLMINNVLVLIAMERGGIASVTDYATWELSDILSLMPLDTPENVRQHFSQHANFGELCRCVHVWPGSNTALELAERFRRLQSKYWYAKALTLATLLDHVEGVPHSSSPSETKMRAVRAAARIERYDWVEAISRPGTNGLITLCAV